MPSSRTADEVFLIYSGRDALRPVIFVLNTQVIVPVALLKTAKEALTEREAGALCNNRS
jgi:hypothetical protein